MSLGTVRLRQAIFQRLKGILSVPVYSHVPDSATFPYVRIGMISGLPWDSKSFDGQEYTVNIHVFNKNINSSITVDELKVRIHEALNRNESILNGLIGSQSNSNPYITLIRFVDDVTIQQSDEIKDGGENYYHGMLRYRVLMYWENNPIFLEPGVINLGGENVEVS